MSSALSLSTGEVEFGARVTVVSWMPAWMGAWRERVPLQCWLETIRKAPVWEGERPREPNQRQKALEFRAREDARPPGCGFSDRGWLALGRGAAGGCGVLADV